MEGLSQPESKESEPAKSLEEERRAFVENFMKPSRELLSMQKGLDENKKAELLRSTEEMANTMFFYENIKSTMGLSQEDIDFVADAQNPYNYTSLSKEEKIRLYQLQARINMGKEIFQRKYSKG